MKILTCNIRCYGARDGDNAWDRRRDFCIEVMRRRQPDLICLQECWQEQHADLTAALPEFDAYGMIDEPLGRHPMNAVFFRRDRFGLVSQGGYWLSQTPHVAGSSAWDSACVRLANWLRLEETATGREFRVVNTHLDHVSQSAREQQARLIVEDAAAYPDAYPQLLTGDMNCDAANPALEVFRRGGWRDTYAQMHGDEDPGHTFHGFRGPDFDSQIGKMDWVLARGVVVVEDAEVIRDADDGRFPSDHYFVGADVRLA